MRFPPALNPLRGTRIAWLLPLAWALVQCAAVTAPVTIEVFLHRRFGARTGKNLLKGFLLLLVMEPVFEAAFPPVRLPLFGLFSFGYAIAAVWQWFQSRFGGQNEHIHSYVNGEPWPFWRRWRVETTTVQRYLEPALCWLIAWIVLLLDSGLAHWLFMASVALFIKEQVRRSHLRTHRLDALDARVETAERTPRLRAENEPFVEARPAPPRWRANAPGAPRR